MTTKWKAVIFGVPIAVMMLCVMGLCAPSLLLAFLSALPKNDKNSEALACPSLPQSFSEVDLIGTWVGKYFGDTDKLIIQANGTYKQIYSADSYNFESDWKKWHIEHDSDGYLRLHLAGMRRCDGLRSDCTNPEGGFSHGSTGINPCKSNSAVFLNHEVILFITGTTGNHPKGIILQQARLAGSDWTYSFELEK